MYVNFFLINLNGIYYSLQLYVINYYIQNCILWSQIHEWNQKNAKLIVSDKIDWDLLQPVQMLSITVQNYILLSQIF